MIQTRNLQDDVSNLTTSDIVQPNLTGWTNGSSIEIPPSDKPTKIELTVTPEL